MKEKSRGAGDVDPESEESERVHTVKEYKEQLVELNRRRDLDRAVFDDGHEFRIDSNASSRAGIRERDVPERELFTLDELMAETTVMTEEDIAYEQQRLTETSQQPVIGTDEDMVAPDLIATSAVPETAKSMNVPSSNSRLGTLVVSLQGRHQVKYPLYEGEITIGRLKDNDIQINSEFVSRAHARIVIGAEGAVIEDVSSKNGVMVDSTSVRRHVFNDGDTVILGTTQLTYFTSNDVKE